MSVTAPPALDLSSATTDPVLAVVESAELAAAVAGRTGLDADQAARRLADVASEARLALALLARADVTGGAVSGRVLEVGAGTGLVAALLRRAGAAVTAIDPLVAGFDLFAAIRAELEVRLPDVVLAVDRRAATELDPARDGRFDLVFSINVLEHCQPLAATLDALAAVLAPGGRMVHACPNYRVPYEPHFAIPLVPGAPRLTARLRPALAGDPLWHSLNFITAGDAARFAARAGLGLRLVPGLAGAAVDRLASDPAFARRQGVAGRVIAAAARTGARAWLDRIPPAWMTPMVMVLERPRHPA